MRLSDILEYLKPRPITQSDAFKAWFSGSKIVDAEGNPLVLYHGTSKDVDFKAFKLPKNGTWFTKDAAGASDYAIDNDSQNYKYDGGTYVKTNTASRVIPVFVKALNPKHYPAYPHELQTADAGESGVGYRKAQGNLWGRLKAEGHDAVIIGDYDVVVVLGGPEQIKSAVGNSSFNPSKKNMHESVEEFDILGKDVLVIKNPSPMQMASVLKRWKEMRGFVVGNDVWIWNAFDAVHFQVEAAVGVAHRDAAEFLIRPADPELDKANAYEITVFQRRDVIEASEVFERTLSRIGPYRTNGWEGYEAE